nr:DUF397 domain-containing protein [Micromonospora sp. DSM 115978]
MSSVDSRQPVWRKSSRSPANGGTNCVEIAELSDGRIGVRDSKDPNGGILVFDRAAAIAWLSGLAVGR